MNWSRTRARRRAAIVAASLVLIASCASERGAPSAPGVARVEPSLEQIFLLPPLTGVAPRVDSLSADGAWALVKWSPLVTAADGKRKLDSERGELHLLDVGAPGDEGAGPLLAEMLERIAGARSPAANGNGKEARGEQRNLTTAWSSHGRRLAVVWGDDLLLLDAPDGAGDWKPTVLHHDPPPPPKAAAKSEEKPAAKAAEKAVEKPEAKEPPKADAQESAPAPQSGELAAWPERLGKVRALHFNQDDSVLEVTADKELFLFPLNDVTKCPLALDATQWPTRRLDPSVADVELDDLRTIAFGRSTALGQVQIPAAVEGEDVKRVDAHVLELRTGRLVVLEGRADMKAVEDTDLSPDGRFVFASEVDHSDDPAPTLIPDYLTERVTTISGRRELADTPHAPRKLWMWSTSDGSRKALELPGENTYTLFRIGWAPQKAPGDKARLAFRRLSSDYRTIETWVWTEGELKLVLSDHDERWIGGPTVSARWTHDGKRIVFSSEWLATSSTPGHCQVFELDPDSGAVVQLTHVEGEVSSFAERGDGRVVFTASRADPAQRCIGVAYLSGAGATKLGDDDTTWHGTYYSAPPGWNDDIDVADEGDQVLFAHEELGLPPELWRQPLGPSGAAQQVTHTIPSDYAHIDWIRPVKLTTQNAEGLAIRSHVYLPRATSLEHPDRARACVVFIHGAGYLQNVTDSMTQYAVNMLFHSRLAAMGYVVLDVDYRGSAGYGAKFRSDVQFNLGKYELDDIDLAVDELGRRGVIDTKRVGCYGGSYGGFLTLMALFMQGERWTCGAALRSVTDWRTYHPGYTQPRLGRPSTNADAYARSSPIDHADKLTKPLLILHGMVDTNVFAQDSVRLIEKLIDLGKEFDAMLYPSQGHGFEDGNHWLDEYKRIESFLTQHLGAP
jgi:dipeptidyl aminopeptidase/acylaminoacyl peptidase